MSQIIVRKYREDDRESVRKISWDTAFISRSADAFFEGKDILADFLTAYFTDYEPKSCFVAEADGKVVGYLLGAKDTVNLERVFIRKIFLPLLLRALGTGAGCKRKNWIFGFSCFLSFLRREFSEPNFSREYPATLHINLDAQWRGQKIGSGLIMRYLDYLKQEKVTGVHLATMSERGAEFFAGQGFNLLHKGHRSYLRYLLHKDIPIYIYGKKI